MLKLIEELKKNGISQKRLEDLFALNVLRIYSLLNTWMYRDFKNIMPNNIADLLRK